MVKIINLLKKEPIQLIHLVDTESETLHGKFLGIRHWDTIELVAKDVNGFDVITLTRDGSPKYLALGYWNDGVIELPF
jgi:hypothetical protein